MIRKNKRLMTDSATILTLGALPDDLWQRVEWLLNKFDPPKPRGRKREPKRQEYLKALLASGRLTPNHQLTTDRPVG